MEWDHVNLSLLTRETKQMQTLFETFFVVLAILSFGGITAVIMLETMDCIYHAFLEWLERRESK